MAFMGRGDMPSINFDNKVDGNQDDKIKNQEDFFRPYYFYYGRYCCYVPIDSTYVIMSTIITLIILIAVAIGYVFTYKSTIIDPIENVKKLYLNSYLIIITALLGITIIANLFSKSEKMLIKRLIFIFTISIIIMLSFFGIKVDLDNTYTKEKFGQFYTEQDLNEQDDIKSKVDAFSKEMSVKTEKDYYVDECLKLYNIFKIKTYITLGLNFLLNILLIFQMLRIFKIHNQKVRMNKDDLILFDEEQNIRY